MERWLAIRKEEGLKIDPETAEVYWSYEQVLDPYGVLDEWELPEEFYCVGRAVFRQRSWKQRLGLVRRSSGTDG